MTHEPLAVATPQPETSIVPPSSPEVASNPPATSQPENAATQPVKPKAKTKHHKTHPALRGGTSLSPSTPPATQPAQAVTFVQAKAQTPEVQALEARLAAAQQLPLEKQPLDDFLTAYSAEEMNPNLPLEDQRIVMTRVLQLKRSQALAASLKSLPGGLGPGAGGTAGRWRFLPLRGRLPLFRG